MKHMTKVHGIVALFCLTATPIMYGTTVSSAQLRSTVNAEEQAGTLLTNISGYETMARGVRDQILAAGTAAGISQTAAAASQTSAHSVSGSVGTLITNAVNTSAEIILRSADVAVLTIPDLDSGISVAALDAAANLINDSGTAVTTFAGETLIDEDNLALGAQVVQDSANAIPTLIDADNANSETYQSASDAAGSLANAINILSKSDNSTANSLQEAIDASNSLATVLGDFATIPAVDASILQATTDVGGDLASALESLASAAAMNADGLTSLLTPIAQLVSLFSTIVTAGTSDSTTVALAADESPLLGLAYFSVAQNTNTSATSLDTTVSDVGTFVGMMNTSIFQNADADVRVLSPLFDGVTSAVMALQAAGINVNFTTDNRVNVALAMVDAADLFDDVANSPEFSATDDIETCFEDAGDLIDSLDNLATYWEISSLLSSEYVAAHSALTTFESSQTVGNAMACTAKIKLYAQALSTNV